MKPRDSNQTAPQRRTGIYLRVAMTLVSALLMFEFIRLGLADFMRLQPGAYLDAIRSSNLRPSHSELEQARKRLVVARRLDPANPVIEEYLGQAAFYDAALAGPQGDAQQCYLAEALQRYRQAIRLRPNSGYLWASLMLTRYAMLGGHPAAEQLGELAEAMRHAAQLAPWEPGVVEQIVWVGVPLYRELPAQERGLVDAAIARARVLGIKTPDAPGNERYAATTMP